MCFAIKSYLLNIVMVSVLCQFVIYAKCFETAGLIGLVFNSFLASGDFCHPLITFANSWSHMPHCWKSHVAAKCSLRKIQAFSGQNVGPDLDPNSLTL